MSINGFVFNNNVEKYNYPELDNINVLRAHMNDGAFSDVAPVYSSALTYSAGDYTFKDGSLYRALVDIDTPEAWNAAHWIVVKVGSELEGIKNDINVDPEPISFTSSTGTIKWANGSLGTSSNGSRSATDYTDISSYSKIRYRRMGGLSSSTPANGMAFYDAEKNYISGIPNENTLPSDGYVENYEVDVPPDAVFARFTYITDTTTYGDFYIYGVNPISKKVTGLGEKVNSLSFSVYPQALSYVYEQQGKYVYSDTGEGHSSTNFALTNFVPVTGISKILYSRMIVTSSTPRHGIAFYTSDDYTTYISGVPAKGGASEMSSEMYEVTVPSGANYARFSWFSSELQATYGDLVIYDADQYYRSLNGVSDKVAKLEAEEEADTSHRALLSEAIQSEGVQAAVLRARQFSDILWTPVADMPGIKKNLSTGVYDYKPFKKGVRQKGIPYSRVTSEENRVGDGISFDCFATAVLNPNSYLYSTNIYSAENKRATVYGVVCSKLVQYAWGCPEIYDSQKIENLPGLTKIAGPGEWDENDIKVGDGVLNPQVHCTICTDVLRDVNEVVRAIEITEATTPQCVRRVWNIPEFFEYFGSYGLYRYQYIDDAVYTKSPYIDLEDGLTGTKDIPIAIRRGSYCVVPLNASRAADVDNSKWTTMHVLHNGTETTTAINSDTITVPTSEHGYYEVWPTDASNNRGNSSFYYVIDTPTISSSVSGSTLSLTYSADCPAVYVRWTGGTTHFTFLDGSGSESVTIPENATAFKLAFKSKYGLWWSSSTSLS